MSSSPKYTRVQLVNDAERAWRQSTAAAKQRAKEAAEAAQRARLAARLLREQGEVAATAQNLQALVRDLQADADAAKISVPIADVQRQLGHCAGTTPADLSATHALRAGLAVIERDVKRLRKQFEATKVSRALEGLAGEVARIQAEVAQMDRRESERFDAGALSVIEQAIGSAKKELTARQTERARAGLEQLRRQFNTHLDRVRIAREKYENQRSEAQNAITVITERYRALEATQEYARHIVTDLARLEPELAALVKLHQGDQFDNVHQQVKRLEARLDELVSVAQAKIAQVEKQKAITERLITAVVSARGVLLKGYPQFAEGQPAVIRFHIVGHGVLHVEISAEGPVSVRAEGFKMAQQLTPDGKIEKTCDEFVELFEQVRAAAQAQGLEMGPPHWDGEPTPERARARRKSHSSSQITKQARSRGANQ